VGWGSDIGVHGWGPPFLLGSELCFLFHFQSSYKRIGGKKGFWSSVLGCKVKKRRGEMFLFENVHNSFGFTLPTWMI